MSGNWAGHLIDPLGITPLGKDKPAAAPAPADTTTAATPPVTPLSQTVVGAMQGQVQNQMRRKSINSTIYAGATGGWMPGSPTSSSAPSVSNGATKTG